MGGEQGGAVEAPAHPKLLVGGAAGLSHGQGRRETRNQDHREFSNWQGADEEGLEGLEGFLEGEIDMEDDDPIELEPVEEEVQPAAVGRWQMMARYINLKKPDIDDMSTHFSDVWRLRTGVNFALLGKNWFTVTFFSEGDFEFVARGGPWVYRGYPLLVTKRLENTRPSETILNTVPIWVHVYDLPWNRQKKNTAMLIGNKLGKYLEADLNADGYSPYDFLHVRVDIPIDRRLRPSITTQVKGSTETNTFLLRYERVPYFCFWCGFIGHDDTDCEKRRIGVPSLDYDTRLRCSPVRKFEKRQSYAAPKQHPQARKELNFSISDDSSYTLGVPADRRRNRNVVRHRGEFIPERVDARDGFEDLEKEGSSEVDSQLAAQINKLKMPLVRTETGGRGRGPKKPASRTIRGRGGGSIPRTTNIIESAVPLAMYPDYPSVSFPAGLSSQEMIPLIRGLSTMVFSAGDTYMSDADSILGKRAAGFEEETSKDMSGAMVLRDGESPKGKTKKGWCEEGLFGCADAENLEATSHRAAGQLTGPQGAARQEQ
jgi:hypothetical protein